MYVGLNSPYFFSLCLTSANPFYTGDFAPERLASIRMRKSGIPIGSFPVIEGHHPALVGRELFEEANEGLARNRYACPTKAEGRRPCRG